MRPQPRRSRGWCAALMLTIAVGAALSGCTSAARVDTSRPRMPAPTGSIVPIAEPATSYAGLGPFGRYAKALDTQYGTKPDFVDWDQTADLNCAFVGNGDFESMTEPSGISQTKDEEVVDSAGVTIHPMSGKVWAASITTRCPALLTDYVRTHIEVEETAGLQWVKSVG